MYEDKERKVQIAALGAISEGETYLLLTYVKENIIYEIQ